LLIWWKVIFWKSLCKLSCIYLSWEKLVNKNYFPFKEKFGLVSMKVFFFYFRWKTLFRSCERFRNIILFVDYKKFGPQSFDCYIFCFEFFCSISPLKIWFNFIFILTLVLIFIIVICFSLIIFLIEIFYLSNLILILLIVTYFIWNNLWNCNYYYFNFIIFQFFLSVTFDLHYFDCYLFYLR
jgi:hypothetical protein